MSDDNLLTPKAKDGFTSESPVRAFTEFRVQGLYAIGKGFRPSLAHLTAYLDAMEAKEGWRMAQLILPDNDATDPTIIFHKEGIPPSREITFDDVDAYLKEQGFSLIGVGANRMKLYEAVSMAATVADPGERDDATGVRPMEEIIRPGGRPTFVAAKPGLDDPVNPRHYAGRECADIGERLSANGYQVLKYCWRLGKKDDPCVELGKALWYLDSETKLYKQTQHRGGTVVTPNRFGINERPLNDFLENRIVDQPTFTQNIARMLWKGYGLRELQAIHEAIEEHRFHLDCGRGLAI